MRAETELWTMKGDDLTSILSESVGGGLETHYEAWTVPGHFSKSGGMREQVGQGSGVLSLKRFQSELVNKSLNGLSVVGYADPQYSSSSAFAFEGAVLDNPCLDEGL